MVYLFPLALEKIGSSVLSQRISFTVYPRMTSKLPSSCYRVPSARMTALHDWTQGCLYARGALSHAPGPACYFFFLSLTAGDSRIQSSSLSLLSQYGTQHWLPLEAKSLCLPDLVKTSGGREQPACLLLTPVCHWGNLTCQKQLLTTCLMNE